MAVSRERKIELIKLVKRVTGMKFRYSFKEMSHSAEVDPFTKHIAFAKRKLQPYQRDTEEEFIGDILHELVHIWCWQNGKFKAYHHVPKTRAQKIAHLATAYRAEQWVDTVAKDWAKELFGVGYRMVYTNRPSDKKRFEKSYIEPLKKEWKLGKYAKRKTK